MYAITLLLENAEASLATAAVALSSTNWSILAELTVTV
jgi:hypothetical protein